MTYLNYPKCGTCRKALKWLQENGIEVTSRSIVEKNPTEDELKDWIAKSGLPLTRFFNTSGRIYKEENLKEKVKTESDETLIKILATNGMLVKRPILVSEQFVLVGFKEEEWSEKLK